MATSENLTVPIPEVRMVGGPKYLIKYLQNFTAFLEVNLSLRQKTLGENKDAS